MTELDQLKQRVATLEKIMLLQTDDRDYEYQQAIKALLRGNKKPLDKFMKKWGEVPNA